MTGRELMARPAAEAFRLPWGSTSVEEATLGIVISWSWIQEGGRRADGGEERWGVERSFAGIWAVHETAAGRVHV